MFGGKLQVQQDYLCDRHRRFQGGPPQRTKCSLQNTPVVR